MLAPHTSWLGCVPCVSVLLYPTMQHSPSSLSHLPPNTHTFTHNHIHLSRPISHSHTPQQQPQVQSIADRLATVRFSSPSLASPTTPAAAPLPSSSSSSLPTKQEEEVQEETTAAAAAAVALDPDWHAELAVGVKRGKVEMVAALLEGLEGAFYAWCFCRICDNVRVVESADTHT